MTWLLTALIRFYQTFISPLSGPHCRYYPSCSRYALVAVQRHGPVRGLWLALRRLARCHPWTPGGVDLVPEVGDYRWWGYCPGHDPYEQADPPVASVTDDAATEGA